MEKQEILKRYIIFLVGLFINSLGVAFITKADLGTSPISSIPYTLSLAFRPTIGQFTIVFSLLLIAIQIVLLRKKFGIIQLLQIPVSILFGYFIDFSMERILFWMDPQNYGAKAVFLLIGCMILGFGVFLEVVGNVIMLPGEGVVRAITSCIRKEFGVVKICVDLSMCIGAVVISLVLFHGIRGVGVGTIVAALLVGYVSRVFGKLLKGVTEKILPQHPENAGTASGNEEDMPFVITIAREYGSEGQEIGKALASRLHCKYYDKDLIKSIAQKSGYTEEYISKNAERLTNKLWYELYTKPYAYVNQERTFQDAIFEVEKDLIQEIASKECCVIIGRLSNYILRGYKNSTHIFISADMDTKLKNVMKHDEIQSEDARKKIQRVEKMRKNYCKCITGENWGEAHNYDFCVDVSSFNADQITDMLVSILQKRKYAVQ